MELKKYKELVWADVMRITGRTWAQITHHPDFEEAESQLASDYRHHKTDFEDGKIDAAVFEKGCVSASSSCLRLCFDDFRAKNVVLNIPHSSDRGVLQHGWDEAVLDSVNRWTDWHTDALFNVDGEPNINAAVFPLSRFVCDVERLENDPLEAKGQGIIYTEFDGVKRAGAYSKKDLMALYYTHIDNLKRHLTQDSVLVDCHSFPSDLSDVEICIGYNEDWSKPKPATLETIKKAFDGYKVGMNTPYSNSISPKMPFPYQSVMIEVNKSAYLDGDNNVDVEKFDALRARILGIYKELAD